MNVILGCLVTWGFKLDEKGVDIYKDVKGGFSTPAPYQFPDFFNMLVSSFTIMIVGFIMTIVCAKKMAEKNGYQVSGNRELVFLSYSYSFFLFFCLESQHTVIGINFPSGVTPNTSNELPVTSLTTRTREIAMLTIIPFWFYFLFYIYIILLKEKRERRKKMKKKDENEK